MHSLCRCRCGNLEYYFSTFNSTCPLCPLSTSVCICLCLHLCITIIYLSFSLEVFMCVFLSVLFSFNFSLDSYFLVQPLISLICSLSPGFFFQLTLPFQLGERYTVLHTDLYLTSSVTTANSVTSCISNCSLVKEQKSPPSTSLLRFYEKDTVEWQQQC